MSLRMLSGRCAPGTSSTASRPALQQRLRIACAARAPTWLGSGRGVACRAADPEGSQPAAGAAAPPAPAAATQQQQQPPEQQQQQQQQPAAAPAPSAPLLAPGQGTAIVTGAISILFGVAYLVLVSLLDMRGGELQPPPPEAFMQ